MSLERCQFVMSNGGVITAPWIAAGQMTAGKGMVLQTCGILHELGALHFHWFKSVAAPALRYDYLLLLALLLQPKFHLESVHRCVSLGSR